MYRLDVTEPGFPASDNTRPELRLAGESRETRGGRSDPAGMTLMEIAESFLEVERIIQNAPNARRRARELYDATLSAIEIDVAEAREFGRRLIAEHQRRTGDADGTPGRGGLSRATIERYTPPLPPDRPSIRTAVLEVFTLARYQRPLTTLQIVRALPEVGYSSRATLRSLRSTVNQAVAQLSADGQLRRFRTDETELAPRDRRVRARKYLAVTVPYEPPSRDR